jgi:hypothetical protein
MTKTIHGKVHGKTIELDEDLGVVDGQEVEVQVTIVQPARKWGEGILRTAGALADDREWDTIMEQIYQERKPRVPGLGKGMITIVSDDEDHLKDFAECMP